MNKRKRRGDLGQGVLFQAKWPLLSEGTFEQRRERIQESEMSTCKGPEVGLHFLGVLPLEQDTSSPWLLAHGHCIPGTWSWPVS